MYVYIATGNAYWHTEDLSAWLLEIAFACSISTCVTMYTEHKPVIDVIWPCIRNSVNTRFKIEQQWYRTSFIKVSGCLHYKDLKVG